MKDYINLIIVIAISIIAFVNITRVVWKITNDGMNEKQEIACLSGGGAVVSNDFGVYFSCKKLK